MLCPLCSAEMQEMKTNNILHLSEIPSGALICPDCGYVSYEETEPTEEELASLDLSFLFEQPKQENQFESEDL